MSKGFTLMIKALKGNDGFTLIELLVAISIIAVVFGISVSASMQVQKSGRDSQRQSDLRSIQSALQQYFTDQGFYPDDDTASPLNLSSTQALTSSVGNPSPPNPAKNYLPKIPLDPRNSGTSIYKYQALVLGGGFTNCDNTVGNTNKCLSYCLYAKLESPPSSSMTYPQCSLAGYNFQLIQP